VEDDITQVPGIRVGHWTDDEGLTGCTVVRVPPQGAVASVEVRGAAPGTRETDLLRPERTVEVVHAILLSGGSAFGLAAADGVMNYLSERSIGISTQEARVPIVPTAVLYDLNVGSPDARPDAAAGREACVDSETRTACGSGRFGAGTGATVGKLLGPQHAVRGGVGSASIPLPGGGIVGALAVVNAVGDVVDGHGAVLAGPGTVDILLDEGVEGVPPLGSNTTLVVVATDVTLSKSQAFRLATVAHDGLAQAIRPVHTSYDGDTVFAVSTASEPADPSSTVVLETAAVEAVARAIRRAITWIWFAPPGTE
jgi:L-aminopeptidase/D-esterase-like protein